MIASKGAFPNNKEIVLNNNESPDSKGKIAAFQINKPGKLVETLNGYHLVENGARVYSGNYKPTAADVGAYTKSQGDDRYIGALADVSPTDNDANLVGKGYRFYEMTGTKTNTPTGSGSGNLISLARDYNNAMTYGSQLYLDGNNLWYRGASAGDFNPWKSIYHEGFKPTAADVGAPTVGEFNTLSSKVTALENKPSGPVIPAPGDIGSYGMFLVNAPCGYAGDVFEGSRMKWAAANGDTIGNWGGGSGRPAISGSWKCLGMFDDSNMGAGKNVTIFVRIA